MDDVGLLVICLLFTAVSGQGHPGHPGHPDSHEKVDPMVVPHPWQGGSVLDVTSINHDRGCYSCRHGDSLATCLASPYVCGANQYCKVHVHHDKDIHLECRDLPDYGKCQHENHQHALQDPRCQPLRYPPANDCIHCCQGTQCVRDLFGFVPKTPNAGPVSPKPTTMTTMMTTTNMMSARVPAVLGVTNINHDRGCYRCVPGDTLGACLKSQYVCSQHQYCKVHIHQNRDIHLECKEVNRNEVSHCQHDISTRPVECSVPLHYPPTHDCNYCCQTQQCVNEVFGVQSHAALTTPATTSATTSSPLTPGAGSCLTSSCGYGHAMADCISGQYACGTNQFCGIDFFSNGDLLMRCKDIGQLKACQATEASNNPVCHPLSLVGGHDCSFCCQDRGCVRGVFGVHPTTTVATTTTLATSPSFNTTQPPCQDMYRGDCSVDFAQNCSNPQVRILCPKFCGVCQDCLDKYLGSCSQDFQGQCSDPIVASICPRTCKVCHLQAHKTTPSSTINNTTNTNNTNQANNSTISSFTNVPTHTTASKFTSIPSSVSASINSNITSTIPTHLSTTLPTNLSTTLLTNASTNIPNSTITKPTTNTVPTSSTHISTSTPTTNGATNAALTHLTSTPSSTTSTPTTTLLSTSTVAPCVDQLPGTTCEEPQMLSACALPSIRDLCPVACKVCTPCTDTLPGTTCQEPQMVASCGVQAVRAVCPATCKAWDACPATGNTHSITQNVNVATHSVTPKVRRHTQRIAATQVPTTKQPSSTVSSTLVPYHCRQCGNYTANTPCTDRELQYDVMSPCDDAGARFCMTDVIVDANAKVSIFKRCVRHTACMHEWFIQTSDKQFCLTLDPTSVWPNMACHFCCVGQGCNVGVVPARQDQYRP